jgi:hypothetical protein
MGGVVSTSVTVDASELESLLGKFENAGPVVDREGTAALERSAIIVQNSAKDNLHASGAIDTGQLLNSIAVGKPSAFERTIGTNKQYGEVVEMGRRPGAPMPPSGALLGWMRRHGIPADREYVIRQRIAARGIAARPYLVPALTDNEPAMQREFDLAADRALAELTK